MTVRVAPLLTDEESQELFEANLPLSGVLPLRVELVFQSGVPVEVKRARFRLRDSSKSGMETAVCEERRFENSEGERRLRSTIQTRVNNLKKSLARMRSI